MVSELAENVRCDQVWHGKVSTRRYENEKTDSPAIRAEAAQTQIASLLCRYGASVQFTHYDSSHSDVFESLRRVWFPARLTLSE